MNWKDQTDSVDLRFSKILSIEKGIYRLDFVSYFLKDTLSGEWADDIYGTPIIERQEVLFYRHGELLSKGYVAEPTIEKKTSHNGIMKIPRIPLLEVCLLHSQTGDLYFISGADFCNGVGCPEYLGIYTMEGVPLFEYQSVIGDISRSYPPLNIVMEKYGFDLKSRDACKTIVDTWIKTSQ